MSHHIKVEEDYIKSLLSNAAWGAARVPLAEGKEVETVEEEVHSCPLCASVLDEALSEEVIGEHIETIEGILRLHEEEDLDEEDVDEEDEEDVDEVKRSPSAYRDDDWTPEGDPTDSHKAQNPGEDPDQLRLKDSKKSRVKKKVAGLKKKWTGQKKGDKSKTHKGKDFEKKA